MLGSWKMVNISCLICDTTTKPRWQIVNRKYKLDIIDILSYDVTDNMTVVILNQKHEANELKVASGTVTLSTMQSHKPKKYCIPWLDI